MTQEAYDQVKEAGVVKTTEDDRSMIVNKTNYKVWPYVKFLVPPDIHDTSEGSVCWLLATYFKINAEDRHVWWNGSLGNIAVKKIVADKLSEKRSGAAQAMKLKFWGRWVYFVCLLT